MDWINNGKIDKTNIRGQFSLVKLQKAIDCKIEIASTILNQR